MLMANTVRATGPNALTSGRDLLPDEPCCMNLPSRIGFDDKVLLFDGACRRCRTWRRFVEGSDARDLSA